MAEIVWTEPALQELDAIAENIALDNPPAAGRLVREVLDKTEHLQDFPRSGRTPPELPGSIYREVVVPLAGSCIGKTATAYGSST